MPLLITGVASLVGFVDDVDDADDVGGDLDVVGDELLI